jgi:branched-subunit amino acid aminotransferase/4-amino-4-deoxychorismate lyase
MSDGGEVSDVADRVSDRDAAGDDVFAAGCAWIDGEFVPIADARVPILDTGFVRSDLTYDVAAVWDGRFFRLDDHLERLHRGCLRLRLFPPLALGEIREILIGTVQRSGLRDAYVEAIVTRGIPKDGGRDPRVLQPRFYAFAIPYVWLADLEQQERGVALAIARDTLRTPSESIDPTVKNFQWGDLTRALFEAYDKGAAFPVLTDSSDLVTEGAGYNIFALVDGVLYTPASGALHGITRKTVLEIAEDEGLTAIVGDLPVAKLTRAQEVFLTSTAGGVMPAASLDGEPIGQGSPGEVASRLRKRYWELHYDDRYTLPVEYDRPGIEVGGPPAVKLHR